MDVNSKCNSCVPSIHDNNNICKSKNAGKQGTKRHKSDRDLDCNLDPEKVCRANASRIAIPIEIRYVCPLGIMFIVVSVFLSSVTMHNTHVRMNRVMIHFLLTSV